MSTGVSTGPGSPRPDEALRLGPERLRRRCDPAKLGFATTEEVAPLSDAIGQPRALEAIEFGLEIGARGYNVFATGPTGTGKRTILERHLRRRAAERPPPGDLVCLFNFEAPGRPLVVPLPTGLGRSLAGDTQRLVEEAGRSVRQAFESEGYAERRKRVADELQGRGEEALAHLREDARERNLMVELTPAGMLTLPVAEGKPLDPAQFARLSEEARAAYQAGAKEVEARAPEVMRRLRSLEREASERFRKLDREVAQFAVGHLVDELRTRYEGVPRLGGWFDDALEDMVENVSRFRAELPAQAQLPEPMAELSRRGREEFFARYEANLLVSHDPDGGAPVVFAANPTYYDLFGRIEYQSSFGAISTDHRFVRAGAIQRANGGYLVLQAHDLLAQPFVWTKLKEALRTGKARIENLGAQYMLFPTTTLEPEATELDLKLVLVGSSLLHRVLYLLDEDVRKLFKVKADFDVAIPWGDDGAEQYAAFISRQVRDDGLRHFTSDAVARVVEHGARAMQHQRRLSARFLEVADLVVEADHWAGKAGSELVRAEHVDTAIERGRYRSNLLEEKVRQLIEEGTLLVDVEGAGTGVVNGLAVAALGDYAFGHPVKVTATVAAGDGELLDIDREAKLGGPVHTKGFLVLAGYLRDRYSRDAPLALKASLAFEQSYEEVEGDSAAAAELFALLSALSGTAIRQGVAVTGSVNQQGEIQPIGAVNEKVEGFFEVCRQRGLSGDQGVVVPAANVQHLMLRQELLDAVEAGDFHVWAIRTVEEGIELLTGTPVGERRPDGVYPEGTVNRRIADRLAELAELARRFRDRPGS